ncbi:nuclear transport factor 2 family protein [Streptomyces sp. SL13]|uniref:Nuclear transport factor 2 family protein n=1 Tax=Streptantibioticus silvisoli TaxID=2705255 RepID=A0AA90H975_9ACTN|nr:nuclear transport factor 2 family protein [Streptantibioticus silvisoli]MDI5963818.1 nuclear transport factor 2 family protein [Streptantibioticus silvisoli]MDI5972799.1 nuclear transport factor 2 family protein [Streptantibioticus silvisoli]
MTTTPEVIDRYLKAAEARDTRACAECFTEDGTVLDEGRTYSGRAEIRGWRDHGIGPWTYTSTVTGTERISDGEYRLAVHVVGDFPGGEARLTFAFELAGGLIAALRIL